MQWLGQRRRGVGAKCWSSIGRAVLLEEFGSVEFSTRMFWRESRRAKPVIFGCVQSRVVQPCLAVDVYQRCIILGLQFSWRWLSRSRVKSA